MINNINETEYTRKCLESWLRLDYEHISSLLVTNIGSEICLGDLYLAEADQNSSIRDTNTGISKIYSLNVGSEE